MDSMIQILARELGRSEEHIQNVVTLIDEGATIPFIARYRKELHGSMDDQLLRTLADRLQYLRNLETRKEEVIRLHSQAMKYIDDLELTPESRTLLHNFASTLIGRNR